MNNDKCKFHYTFKKLFVCLTITHCHLRNLKFQYLINMKTSTESQSCTTFWKENSQSLVFSWCQQVWHEPGCMGVWLGEPHTLRECGTQMPSILPLIIAPDPSSRVPCWEEHTAESIKTYLLSPYYVPWIVLDVMCTSSPSLCNFNQGISSLRFKFFLLQHEDHWIWLKWF